MIKNIFNLLLSVLLFNVINVSAANCSSDDIIKLQKEANNIKVSHEIIRKTKTQPLYDFFGNELEAKEEIVEKSIEVSLYNLTNDLFVIQREKNYETYDTEIFLNGEARTPLEYSNEKTILYSDTKNGNYSFSITDYFHYIDYKFDIYSNTCDSSSLRTIEYRVPKYNMYSEEPICQEYPNSTLCQDFITVDINMSNRDFNDEVKKSQSISNNIGEEVEEKRENTNFFKDNIIYFIIAFGIIIVGGTTFIIINKRRKQL